MPECLISLGSNLGDRRSLLVDAAREIAASPQLTDLRLSRLFETPPIGGPGGQHPFLNAVATLTTSLGANELLLRLQSIERRLGRTREERWAARTVDLDVVLYGSRIGQRHELTVPHPRFAARMFVLVPALDVAATWSDPRCGWSVDRLVRHHRAAAPSLALTGCEESLRVALCEALQRHHDIHFVRPHRPRHQMTVTGHAPGLWAIDGAVDESQLHSDPDSWAWVTSEIPALDSADPFSPRMIARLRPAESNQRWPMLQEIWRNAWAWPEYVVDFRDPDEARLEIIATLESLRCPVEPVTVDDSWWQ